MSMLKGISSRIAATTVCFIVFISSCAAQSAFNINLDAIRQSVVFLHIVDSNGTLKEAGTGFSLSFQQKVILIRVTNSW